MDKERGMMENRQKKAASLTVLEYPYAYGAWQIDPDDHSRISSERKPFYTWRRAVEDYRLCGVSGKAGIPYEIIQITGEEYPDLEPYQAIPLSLAKACEKAIKNGQKVLVSSGYCALAPAVAGGIQKALGPDKKTGIVWMDAHTDNKIVENSGSRDLRFVGFPLSAIAGQTMEQWRKQYCCLEQPYNGADILISDGRCASQEGLENLKKAGSLLVTEQEFEDSSLWKNRVQELADRVDAIYLMVDGDIMKSECIPAYFRKEPGGHDVEKVMENIRTVISTGKVTAFSCFCIDFDKCGQGEDVSYLNGMRLIGAGLDAWGKKDISKR